MIAVIPPIPIHLVGHVLIQAMDGDTVFFPRHRVFFRQPLLQIHLVKAVGELKAIATPTKFTIENSTSAPTRESW